MPTLTELACEVLNTGDGREKTRLARRHAETWKASRATGLEYNEILRRVADRIVEIEKRLTVVGFEKSEMWSEQTARRRLHINQVLLTMDRSQRDG